MNRTGHHGEGPAGVHHAHSPSWMRAHHDWRFWAAVVLMFGAMIIYLMSDDLAWRPRIRPVAPLSDPVGR